MDPSFADQKSVYIVAAARTAIGSFNGSFASLPAHSLGAAVIQKVLQNSNISGEEVDEVIMGQALSAGQGQNPARQAAFQAGIPQEIPSYGVNMLCGSGLKAVYNGYQSIQSGESSIVVAGGQESMSRAPHCIHIREGTRLGNASMVDTMVHDGLTDAFHDYHMGITAENVAEKYQITRENQDQYAFTSQLKAEKASNSGIFKTEIVPVPVKIKKSTTVVENDEYIRKNSALSAFSKLNPCFKNDGTVTPGNSSGINDGAAAVLLMSSIEASQRGLDPLCRIVSFAQTGVDPSIMGTGPISATRKALQKANWHIDDVDLFEFNEAFASQALAVVQELGVDPDKVNIHGGAIALGHPIGASGARILVTLIHAMQLKNAKRGVAALCVGGGMGIAICVERVE